MMESFHLGHKTTNIPLNSIPQARSLIPRRAIYFFLSCVKLSPVTYYVLGIVQSIEDAEMNEPWLLFSRAHHKAGYPGTCNNDEQCNAF